MHTRGDGNQFWRGVGVGHHKQSTKEERLVFLEASIWDSEHKCYHRNLKLRENNSLILKVRTLRLTSFKNKNFSDQLNSSLPGYLGFLLAHLARGVTFQDRHTTLRADSKAVVMLWKAAQDPSNCACHQEALQIELFRSENHRCCAGYNTTRATPDLHSLHNFA